jgi:hypothetical protein
MLKEEAWGSWLWFLLNCDENERQRATKLFKCISAAGEGLGAADDDDGSGTESSEDPSAVSVELSRFEDNPLVTRKTIQEDQEDQEATAKALDRAFGIKSDEEWGVEDGSFAAKGSSDEIEL